MKRFFVATCCSLMLCGSLMAQEATIAAPAAPGEDVAAAVVEAPVAAASAAVVQEQPVAESVAVEGSVLTDTYVANPGIYQEAVPAPMYDSGAYGQVVNPGCSSCGGNVAPMTMMAPQTFTAQSYAGDSYMGSVMAAPVSGCSSCGQAAPVADCGCAPVNDCGCDPCSRNRRQAVRTVSTRSRGMFTRVRSRAGSRNNCCCN